MTHNKLLINVKNFKYLVNKSFRREKDLRNYIIHNIVQFTTDVLEDKYVYHETEYMRTKHNWVGLSRRIDLIVQGVNKLYIIELKNPRYQSENRGAIGQLLCYGYEFLDPKKELVLISTKFDIHTALAIQKYSIPIRYIYFDRDKCLEFLEYNKNE